MLPKINRVKKKNDFEAIFKKGFSFKNNLFVLRFLKNGFDFSRFGFVVSLKVSKKAVVRNKIRRRLSEIVSSQMENIKPGIDVALIAQPGIEKKDFPELKESLTQALIKTKISKK